MNSLPNYFKSLINAIEYGKRYTNQRNLIKPIRARDFKAKMREGSSREGLFVRGRPATRNGSNNYGNYWDKSKGRGQSHGRSHSKSKFGGKRCYYYNKESHFKRDCKKMLRDEKGRGHTENREASIAKGE